MLVLRETDKLNIDLRRFGRDAPTRHTNTLRIDPDKKIAQRMPKKSESNLNPKTSKLKEGGEGGGSSSGGAVANSGQTSQH